jgi:hypothetical protein
MGKRVQRRKAKKWEQMWRVRKARMWRWNHKMSMKMVMRMMLKMMKSTR